MTRRGFPDADDAIFQLRDPHLDVHSAAGAPPECRGGNGKGLRGVSYDHLKKAAAETCRLGYLETARGRSGGFRLVKDPNAIRIGTIIRQTEGDVILVECFDAKTNNVPAAHHLPRMGPPQEALAAVFAVLDGSTLAAPIRYRRCSAFGGMRAIREPRIRNRNLLSGSVSRTLGIS